MTMNLLSRSTEQRPGRSKPVTRIHQLEHEIPNVSEHAADRLCCPVPGPPDRQPQRVHHHGRSGVGRLSVDLLRRARRRGGQWRLRRCSAAATSEDRSAPSRRQRIGNVDRVGVQNGGHHEPEQQHQHGRASLYQPDTRSIMPSHHSSTFRRAFDVALGFVDERQQRRSQLPIREVGRDGRSNRFQVGRDVMAPLPAPPLDASRSAAVDAMFHKASAKVRAGI